MNSDAVRILIIEDNIGDAKLISETIKDTNNFRCRFDHAFRLATGLEQLEKNQFDVVLLDLGLPDSEGLEGLMRLHEAAPSLPIVILTGLDDEEMAFKAMQLGAQDYLIKQQIDSSLLIRSIRYAIERKKNEEKVRLYVEELKNNQIQLEKNARQLEQLNSQLQAVNASKDKFLSIISHDLKSPFQGLLGISEALAHEYSNLQENERVYYAEAMYNTIQHMNKLIDNVLQWSRLETDKFPYHPIELEPVHEAQYILSVMETRLIGKNIKVRNNIERSLRVFADPDMVHSIIQNLLTNAVKFSREGSMINLFSFDSEDGLAGIAVQDNGIGMKGDDLENIFRIDVRISRAGTNDEKGTGLGLIICREMVEKHGGRIWAESRPGEGSTFMFTLPRVCSN